MNNTPSAQIIGELTRTAELLEKIRAILGGKQVRVSSGYRCLDLNRAIRSSDTSAHVLGQAADFTVPEFGSPLTICHELANHKDDLQFDQLIHEFQSWVHVGRRSNAPRGQLLTINDAGTRVGFD